MLKTSSINCVLVSCFVVVVFFSIFRWLLVPDLWDFVYECYVRFIISFFFSRSSKKIKWFKNGEFYRPTQQVLNDDSRPLGLIMKRFFERGSNSTNSAVVEWYQMLTSHCHFAINRTISGITNQNAQITKWQINRTFVGTFVTKSWLFRRMNSIWKTTQRKKKKQRSNSLELYDRNVSSISK